MNTVILSKLCQQLEDSRNNGTEEELQFAETILSLYRKGLVDVSISAETGELLYSAVTE